MIRLKFTKSELIQNQGATTFCEKITFGSEVFEKMHNLRNLKDVEVSGSIHYDDKSEVADVLLKIKGIMVVPCAITNEDVDYPFDSEGDVIYAFHKVEKDSDIIEAKGDVIELMPQVFQQIILEIPLKVVKEGLKEYPHGNGWEVMKEEDLNREKAKKIDPRMAKLAEFKFDGDEEK